MYECLHSFWHAEQYKTTGWGALASLWATLWTDITVHMDRKMCAHASSTCMNSKYAHQNHRWSVNFNRCFTASVACKQTQHLSHQNNNSIKQHQLRVRTITASAHTKIYTHQKCPHSNSVRNRTQTENYTRYLLSIIRNTLHSIHHLLLLLPKHHHHHFSFAAAAKHCYCLRTIMFDFGVHGTHARAAKHARACLLACLCARLCLQTIPIDQTTDTLPPPPSKRPLVRNDRPTDRQPQHTLLLSGYTNARYSIIASRIGIAIGRVRCYAMLCHAMLCGYVVMRCNALCVYCARTRKRRFVFNDREGRHRLRAIPLFLSLSVQRCWFYYAWCLLWCWWWCGGLMAHWWHASYKTCTRIVKWIIIGLKNRFCELWSVCAALRCPFGFCEVGQQQQQQQ